MKRNPLPSFEIIFSTQLTREIQAMNVIPITLEEAKSRFPVDIHITQEMIDTADDMSQSHNLGAKMLRIVFPEITDYNWGFGWSKYVGSAQIDEGQLWFNTTEKEDPDDIKEPKTITLELHCEQPIIGLGARTFYSKVPR